MIQVVFRFERDSMELWVNDLDAVQDISAMVFNQKPQLVIVEGFEKEGRYNYEEHKEVGVTYRAKTLSFPSVKVWGLEVTDYTPNTE
jgi:hypothetical protein